jgi:plastocyanin domain-containing protein
VVTVPFTLRVGAMAPAAAKPTAVPAGAIRIRVDSGGFTPSRITLPAGTVSVLAFDRPDTQNCASSVVFPQLGVKSDLRAGQITIIKLPAYGPRELHFACGMGMYRGSVVLSSASSK